ncbi:LytTR family DNA-binding domain-containing protein [Pigmentiphaga soli]|uniref:LytTR family DNA-binding domain-containing protein n=1 Tax=Pigmentiphaga soli TaxID=1007095 RepID=A0ABP8H9Z6_9BURK
MTAPAAVAVAASPAVLIVGRDPAARRRFRSLLRQLRARMPLGAGIEAASGDEALRLAARTPGGIVLLDAALSGGSALGLARALRALREPPQVVLVASAEIAAQSASLDLADCLLRPVRVDRLALALSRALARLRAGSAPRTAQRPVGSPGGHDGSGGEDNGDGAHGNPDGHGSHDHQDADHGYIAVLDRGRSLAVPVAEVVYLRAQAKYVTIRMRDGELLTADSLDRFERAFPGRFVRIHRNALVARAAIAGACREPDAGSAPDADPFWHLLLHGVAERLPVARRRWPGVRRLLPAGAGGPTMTPAGAAPGAAAPSRGSNIGR